MILIDIFWGFSKGSSLEFFGGKNIKNIESTQFFFFCVEGTRFLSPNRGFVLVRGLFHHYP